MQATTPKTNWIRQLYYYIIIAGTLTIFCYGIFTFGRAALIRFVFPKASNSMYGISQFSSDQQCKMGGNQYYSPKSMIMQMPVMDSKTPYISPTPTELEVKECIEATNKGINEDKDRSFQYDAVKGLSLMFITGIVLGGHYLKRNFFLSKE